MADHDYEKLGVFYLGKEYDFEQKRAAERLLLYDSKDLTTHAVCIGMTGSGKTGLCLSLLEEAAIDRIPAIAIDPKGDLGNLLLTFPGLAADDFRPWIDPAAAARAGRSVDQFAADTAERWRAGLAEWGQTPERIAMFRESADLAIYTPGAAAGLQLSVLRSFAAPPAAVLHDADALRSRIVAAAAGLLALLGIDADPVRSREHILLSNLLERAWRAGRDVDLAALIRDIQSPPLERVGVFDLDTFYPAADRRALAMQLNNLLASPTLAGWLEGGPLDVQQLLYTSAGKPRLSILSISHLSDAERMFFVTLLLSEVLSWMRAQPGTPSLRAILYMDEVFGYFPPSANPPSKLPMLTLLKQARAHGLGVVLATQNPVDLDYKGLANCGTWFLGRLQTERDKARVLDGLAAASAEAAGQFDRRAMEQLLSSLGSRVFLMNNVHDDRPTLFQSRWALSYLAGPLTREQIRTLMAERIAAQPATSAATAAAPSATGSPGGEHPLLPSGVREYYLAPRRTPMGGERILYRPVLLARGRLHYVKAPRGVDLWRIVALWRPAHEEIVDAAWDDAVRIDAGELDLEREPAPNATFAATPAALLNAKSYTGWERQLKDYLYRAAPLVLWQCPALKATSQPDESEADFRIRVQQLAREQRDVEVEKLRQKFAARQATLQQRLRAAEQRVEKQKAQYGQAKLNTALSFGASLLSALLGRKIASTTNVTRASSSLRSAGRAAQQRTGVAHAEEKVEDVARQIDELAEEFEREATELEQRLIGGELPLTSEIIAPRKGDLAIEELAVVWAPYLVGADGVADAAFDVAAIDS